MTWILITNDDGAEARSLVPLAQAVGSVAPVRVVVPHTERSWIGKAITRFEPVHTERLHRDGVEIVATTGYPADCVQLGVNTLFDTPPALVVSGINLGYNYGSAYLQTSGTVGAVIEAAIAGVDGLALSTGPDGDFRTWREWAVTAAADTMWIRLSQIAADMTAAMLRAGPRGVAVSVNLPDHADADTERRVTKVADTGYDRLFRRSGTDEYTHDYGGGLHRRSVLEGTDLAAAADGVISISAVRGVHGAALPPALGELLTGDRRSD